MVGVLIQTMPMLLFSVHRHFVLVGGDVPGVPLVWVLWFLVRRGLTLSTLPEWQHWRERWHVTSALPMPVFVKLAGNFSFLPLCQMCFKLLSRWERCWADHTSRPAGSMVVHGSSGNDAKAKLLCSAFSAMGGLCFFQGDSLFLPESWNHWECRKMRLISPVWYHLPESRSVGKQFMSLLPWSRWWQVGSAIPAGAHQPTTGNGHLPVKEHSSCRSATNDFLCYGDTRWLLSPVTIKPRQSYGKTTQNDWIAIHNSSMSTLLTCQILNPFQLGTMHMNSVCKSCFLQNNV